jgi:hypothetical protein
MRIILLRLLCRCFLLGQSVIAIAPYPHEISNRAKVHRTREKTETIESTAIYFEMIESTGIYFEMIESTAIYFKATHALRKHLTRTASAEILPVRLLRALGQVERTRQPLKYSRRQTWRTAPRRSASSASQALPSKANAAWHLQNQNKKQAGSGVAG